MPYQPFASWVALHKLVAELAERLRRSPATPEPGEEDLRTCRSCRQPFLHPLDRHEEGESEWRILLRCGNCDRRWEVVATDRQTTRLECDVARDIVTIRRALERLDRERFEVQADAFAAALDHDLVDASDFA